jgi:acyl-CoA thioesterase-1
MVSISDPEGTVFDTLRSSIMKLFLLSLILVGACALAACRDEAERSSSTEPAGTRTPPADSTTSNKSLPKIVAFGDSLTAGYGLAPAQSYPSLLQQKLDTDGYKYEVVNAGISGDTSAGGIRRIDWSLEGDVKIVILELGANDILRLQPIDQMKKNLSRIIERAKAKGAKVLLAGMEAPTNSGPLYARQVHEAFIDLAKEYDIAFIPFFLEGVAGIQALNQNDGIHPNEVGTRVVAENVYKHLTPLLEK